MEIDIKYKINLFGFVEQDLPYQCPECKTELDASHIIGFGDYPKGGYRSKLKPNQLLGCGFECPSCFCKSCFHGDEFAYKMFLDNIKFKNIK